MKPLEFRSFETLLKAGEFAPNTRMAHAAEAARAAIVENARIVLDTEGSIPIQLRDGAIVRYTWDTKIGGWQAVI